MRGMRRKAKDRVPSHEGRGSRLGILGAIAALAALAPGGADAQMDPQMFERVTRPQLERLQAEKAARSPAQKKIESSLLEHVQPLGPRAATAAHPAPHVSLRADGALKVTIRAKVTPDLLAAIRQSGGRVVDTSPSHDLIDAEVPPNAVERIAGRADVRALTATAESLRNQAQPSTLLEGDVAHAADFARANFAGATGRGIKVCVISFNDQYVTDLQQSQPQPKLPSVTILSRGGAPQSGPAGEGDGEGAAMLQIVHKLAPDAELMFATGKPESALIENIKALGNEGCRIIVDDISNRTDSPFQDSPTVKSVSDVVAKGILYISAVGNFGNLAGGSSATWEGDFKDSGSVLTSGAKVHVFDRAAASGVGRFNIVYGLGAKNIDSSQACPLNAQGRSAAIANLFWSDPLGASSNDYDLHLVSALNGSILYSSTTVQSGTSDPYEVVPVIPNTALMITKAPGAQDRFLHLDVRPHCGRLQYATGGSARGQNAAENALSVGAVSAKGLTSRFTGGPSVQAEPYSSDGPRRMFFDANGNALTPGNFSSTGGKVLAKPDLVAADQVNTDVPNFQPFWGSSAAAPHVAAIAALLWSTSPTMVMTGMQDILLRSAIQIENVTGSARSGAGILMADSALGYAYPDQGDGYRWIAEFGNTPVRTNMGWSGGSNGAYWAQADFPVRTQPTNDWRLTLRVRARGAASVPISLKINDQPLLDLYGMRWEGPAGQFVTEQHLIPKSLLRQGSNSITILTLRDGLPPLATWQVEVAK